MTILQDYRRRRNILHWHRQRQGN